MPLGFAFYRLVLKLSAFKERRAQGHSRISQKRLSVVHNVVHSREKARKIKAFNLLRIYINLLITFAVSMEIEMEIEGI